MKGTYWLIAKINLKCSNTTAEYNADSRLGCFLWVVNDDYASILHVYRYIEPLRSWSHNLDLLGSHDVIGHVVVIRSAVPDYPTQEPKRKWIG